MRDSLFLQINELDADIANDVCYTRDVELFTCSKMEPRRASVYCTSASVIEYGNNNIGHYFMDESVIKQATIK